MSLGGVKMTNHELAKRYKDKCRLIGKDILEIKLLDGDRVKLMNVKDKEDTGRLVIPSFVTDIMCDVTSDLVVGSVLRGCRFEEVYIDNKCEISLRGLCSNMKSKSLKVGVRDISKITDMSYLFDTSIELKELDIRGLKGENRVRDMSYMFNACIELERLDMGGLYTGRVKNVSNMFRMCNKLEYIDTSIYNGSKLEYIDNMFNSCTRLSSIDVSNINTSKIKSMYNVFNNCKSLRGIDLSSWDMGLVEDMSYIFNSCDSLECARLGRNKTKNLKRAINMFSGCKELRVIDMGDIWLAGLKKTRELLYIFKGCNKLEMVILDKHIGDIYVVSFLVSGAGCDRGIIELV